MKWHSLHKDYKYKPVDYILIYTFLVSQYHSTILTFGIYCAKRTCLPVICTAWDFHNTFIVSEGILLKAPLPWTGFLSHHLKRHAETSGLRMQATLCTRSLLLL